MMSDEKKKIYYYKTMDGKYIYGTPRKRPDLLDEVLGTDPKDYEIKKQRAKDEKRESNR